MFVFRTFEDDWNPHQLHKMEKNDNKKNMDIDTQQNSKRKWISVIFNKWHLLIQLRRLMQRWQCFFKELQIRKYTFLSPSILFDMEMKIEWIV